MEHRPHEAEHGRDGFPMPSFGGTTLKHAAPDPVVAAVDACTALLRGGRVGTRAGCRARPSAAAAFSQCPSVDGPRWNGKSISANRSRSAFLSARLRTGYVGTKPMTARTAVASVFLNAHLRTGRVGTPPQRRGAGRGQSPLNARLRTGRVETPYRQSRRPKRDSQCPSEDGPR